MSMTATLSWSPVALSADLPACTVLPATLPSGPIAVWRSQSGQVIANKDRCPHRGMRLSHGFVRGEKLSCIYHGWSFAKGGGCTSIPAHPKVTPPASIHCGVMPSCESDGLIWASSALIDMPPPRFEGYKPLRLLRMDVNLDQIEQASGATSEGQSVTLVLAGIETRLIFADLGRAATNIFVMVPTDLTPNECIAVSRAIEILRMQCEALSAEVVMA